MARSVYRHSPTRVWLARHRWIVRAAVVAVVAATASGVTLAVASRHDGGARIRTGTGPTSAGHAEPFALTSTTPSNAASDVPSDSAMTLRLTDPVDLGGPLPTLAPPVAGSWVQSGPETLTFEATAPLIPGSAETLTIPGGPGGLRTTAGQTLPQPVTVSFTVARSTVRLQQLLALLGYLPVTFTPTGPAPAPKETAQPQPGTFAWRWANSLSGLEDSWAPGYTGVMTTGAIMTFQDQHQLTVDGLAGPRVWSALLQSASAGTVDPRPYDYAYVSKVLPENLTLYVNGTPQFTNIPVNTGVPGVDTPDGTYPVFEHVTASEMKGTNLDGSTYDDPAVPWASYFFNGDALHGFVRNAYGYPQSNGCVEMSIANAGTLWPYTPIGTLVTVAGPAAGAG